MHDRFTNLNSSYFERSFFPGHFASCPISLGPTVTEILRFKVGRSYQVFSNMGQNESSTLKAHNFFNICPRDLGQIGGCSVEKGHSKRGEYASYAKIAKFKRS